MIRHGRDRELDPFARVLLALPVERLMIGVFVDQDHRQQARPGKAPRDHMERGGRLRDLLAMPAAELLPHMLGHEPLPRDDVERLGDVFADLRQLRGVGQFQLALSLITGKADVPCCHILSSLK
jgi:hypothetical protein